MNRHQPPPPINRRVERDTTVYIAGIRHIAKEREAEFMSLAAQYVQGTSTGFRVVASPVHPASPMVSRGSHPAHSSGGAGASRPTSSRGFPAPRPADSSSGARASRLTNSLCVRGSGPTDSSAILASSAPSTSTSRFHSSVSHSL